MLEVWTPYILFGLVTLFGVIAYFLVRLIASLDKLHDKFDMLQHAVGGLNTQVAVIRTEVEHLSEDHDEVKQEVHRFKLVSGRVK